MEDKSLQSHRFERLLGVMIIRSNRIIFVLIGFLILGWNAVRANPSEGSVAAGSAAITGQGTSTVTINQSSNTAIINWQSFSISTGELTKFIQPSASSATLNRVLGGGTSFINGTLSANGQIYLINQNGIVIGAGGMINTAGFIASTRDISDQDFLKGNLHFSGSADKGVKNLGTINALGGNVYLLGKTVENQGTIQATGTAGLISGDDILLAQKNSDGSTVTVNPSDLATSDLHRTAVSNTGLISASSAELKAANGNLYALAINNTGTIRATTVTKQGGHIWLTASSGAIRNTGTLDASATAAGGKGGTILVKSSTGQVTHSGKILAQGGTGGVGGDVEISAPQVELTGTVDTLSIGGAGGNFLLDPATFTVTANATGADQLTGTQVGKFIDSNSGFTINADNTITVNDGITWTSANSLTLSTNKSGSTITINAPISGTAGGLTLAAAGASDLITTGAKGTINVANFILKSGYWDQGVGDANNAGLTSLPSFTVKNDFELQGTSTFLRAAGGDGSVGNPYKIADIYGLQGIGSPSYKLLGSNYVQTAAIDASITSKWNNLQGFVPIATSNNKFTGTYNGQGYAINNLTLNRPSLDRQALFAQCATAATLSNIVLNNESVRGRDYCGGLAGYTFGTFINDTVKNSTIAPSGSYAGGLIGFYGGGGGISNSSSQNTSVSGGNNIGGLVGSIAANTTLSNDYTSNNTTGGNTSIGGLVGNSGANTTLSNDYTVNDTTSGIMSVGGLAGSFSGSSLTQSYSYLGTVTGGNSVGGLVGTSSGAVTQSFSTTTVKGSTQGTGTILGGLIGLNSGTVTGAYSTGSVTGLSYVGGLFGQNTAAVTAAYTTSKVTGTTSIGALAGSNTGSLTSVYWVAGNAPAAVGTGTAPVNINSQQTLAKLAQASTYDSKYWTFTPGNADYTTGNAGFAINGFTNPLNSKVDSQVNSSTGSINAGLPYFQWYYPTVQYTAQNQVLLNGSSLVQTGYTTKSTATSSTTLAKVGLPTLTSLSNNVIGVTANLNDISATSYNSQGVRSSAAVQTVNGYDAVVSLSSNVGNTSVYGNPGIITASVSTNASGPIFDGMLNLDGTKLASVDGTFNYSTKQLNVRDNAYVFSLTGSNVYVDLHNPAVTPPTLNLTITPRPIAVTLGGNTTKIYDKTNSVTDIANLILTADANNIVNNDKVTVIGGTALYDSVNVSNTAGITETGYTLSNSNYKLVAGGDTVDNKNIGIITPRAVGVSLGGNITKTYDKTTGVNGADNQLVLTATGLISGDTVNVTGGKALYNSVNVSNMAGVTETGYALDNGNYKLAADAGTVSNANIGIINPATLTVQANAGSTKVYGTSDNANWKNAYTVSGLVSNDSATATLGRAVGESVGSYDFILAKDVINDGNNGNNYTVKFDGATNPLVITQATSLVASVAAFKTYGQDDPKANSLAVTLKGLVNTSVNDINGNTTVINDNGTVTDSVSSYTRTPGENAGGTYLLSATLGTLSGAAAGNYQAPTSPINSNLVINKATPTFSPLVLKPGSPILAGGSTTLTSQLNGVSDPDNRFSGPTGSVTFQESGSGKQTSTPSLNATGGASETYNALTVGNYTFAASYGGDQNYNAISFAAGPSINLVVNALPITPVTLSQSSGFNTQLLTQIDAQQFQYQDAVLQRDYSEAPFTISYQREVLANNVLAHNSSYNLFSAETIQIR